MDWYLKVVQNYAGFSGRARRKEYWIFVLINFIISLILAGLQSLLHIKPLLTSLYSLAMLLPSLALSFRRLHDIGKSAWWLLIGLIPFLGAIVILVFMCLDSQEGENQYGPNPKLE